MNKLFHIFGKNSKLIHLTAVTLILCMGLVDMSAYMRYSEAVSVAETADPDSVDVVTEEHEIETALADGYYDGKGSDSANAISSSINLTEGKHLFNILEILPTEKRGVVGYTIGGCEPFGAEDDVYNGRRTSKADLNQAYMDAIFNPYPGIDHNTVINSVLGEQIKEMREKIKEGGSIYPFDYYPNTLVNGYYRRVSDNKGVYRIDNPNNAATRKIESRFQIDSSGNLIQPTRSDYNYIFVYDQASYKQALGDIKVSERRIKYVNNEKFIREWLGKDPSIKSNTQFEVTTRTPVSVTLPDIERADLILINNNTTGTDQYYFALRLKNALNGAKKGNNTQLNKDFYVHYYSPEQDGVISDRSKRMDFIDFEKVIRIYERIVVREDCAIVCEKNCCLANGGEMTQINTNLRKLMFMLFYVQADGELQAGRDLFSDFFKRYTDEPGPEYLEKRKMHLADPVNYPVDYRAAWLKRNGTDPNTPEYYYMHMETQNHIGHPLVVDKSACITGATTENVSVTVGPEDDQRTETVTLPVLDENGKIVPQHDEATIKSRAHTIRTNNDGKKMFDDDGDFDYAGEHNDAWDTWSDSNADQMKYYKSGDEYRYKYCYSSMSNTTDYIYIDNQGRLIVDTQYSSDKSSNPDNYWKYWYKIDADFYAVDGNTFRRRKWGKKVWDVDDPWPWDSSSTTAYMNEWLMHRETEGDIYDCNMHMWYDYGADAKSYGGKVYMTVKKPPFDGKPYKNQSLMEDNGFFKGSWISGALGGREIKREDGDINHVTSESRSYYYSMNILNGDGVNVGAGNNKNKTLYYNYYEGDKIQAEETGTDDAYIPINIEVKSSLEIKNIKVSGGGKSIVYSIANGNPDQDVIKGRNPAEGAVKNSLDLVRKKGPDNSPITTTLSDGTPYYTYEGTINGVLYEWYKNGRNTKIKVEMTVVLPDPGKTERTISDEITIVKRDFFMLD